jgi:hypothetical protein
LGTGVRLAVSVTRTRTPSDSALGYYSSLATLTSCFT